jgi:tetratricopeptide (TPR) repeat protein
MQLTLRHLCYRLRHLSKLHPTLLIALIGRLQACAMVFAGLTFITQPAISETFEQSQLRQGEMLNDQGDFTRAIRILEPLVSSESDALDNVSRGTAWDILASAHQDLGDYEAARRGYEKAIDLLRSIPTASSRYATALANLASVESSMGHFKTADALLRNAKAVCLKGNDHRVLAAIARNRATLAIVRNNTHAARRFLVDAFKEAGYVNNLNESERAEMYSVKAALEARAHDLTTAVLDYQRSIDLWTNVYGLKYHFVAVGYSLQADCYLELGDYSKALVGVTTALGLVEQTAGRNTPLYAEMELSYARLLRAKGDKAEAAKRESDANLRLEAMRHRLCTGCSVSATAFR